MDSLDLVLASVSTIVATGVMALLLFRTPALATIVAAWGAALGGAAGLCAATFALGGAWTGELAADWPVPGGGLIVGVDPLSALFLAPLFALGGLCAVYGRIYLRSHAVAAAELNFLIGAMALVLLARHALLFLVAWEAMTLLAYLLVTVDHGEREVRRAGWVYLIASHVAVIALVALWLALSARSGGALEFAALAHAGATTSAGTAGLLVLALLGFGIKAGVIGLHVWLPEAHAAAPSHVSALMSGVLIKLGLYGLLRTTLLAPPGAWFGITLMVFGIAGALLGIVLALYQRDLKRILAYSSVENVGIILFGLGLGFWAQAHGNGRLSAIAFGGALLHLWNHAAMKGLLFLGAGSVLHGTGTRDVERMGGLLRRMPWTGRAMVVGAVGIAALPPLNGFASEWLLYRALAEVSLHGVGSFSLAAMGGAGALALVGGLAALCFVRLIGVVLLGTPRDEGAASAHESPWAMTIPTAMLAAACVVGASAAPALVSAQGKVLDRLGGASAADVAAAAGSLSPIVLVNAALLIALGLAALMLAGTARRAQECETWGCGYAAPNARMQYTGRAFSEFLTGRVLPRWIRGQVRAHEPLGPFPTAASFRSLAGDPLTRGIYEPFLVRWGDRFTRLRVLQQGNVHIYLLYIVATAITGLGWVAARDWFLQ